MTILAASAAAPCRLSEKAALADETKKSDELARETQAVSSTLLNQDDFVHVQSFAKKCGVLSTQRKNEPVLLKEAVTAKPFTLRRLFEPSDLDRALEVANASCFKKVEVPTLNEQVALPLLSLKVGSLPENIKLKADELKKRFDAVEHFICCLPSLLDEADIKRLGKPFQEFKTRFETIKEELTRADCFSDLEGIKTAITELDTLISDLSTLSTKLYQSQTPDVEKTGNNLTIGALVWTTASSVLSLGAWLLWWPVFVPVIAGVASAVAFAGLRLWQIQQESTCKAKAEQWEKSRASLSWIQEEIKSLHTKIEEVEEDIMEQRITEKVINNLDQMIAQRIQDQINNSQTDSLVQTLQQRIEDLEMQLQAVKEESTKAKSGDPLAKSENTSAMRRVA